MTSAEQTDSRSVIADLFHPPVPSGAGHRYAWGNLSGSSAALALTGMASKTGQPVLVITPDTLSANRLQQELEFFAGTRPGLPVLLFPDWETLPYDSFSPHQDIISQRLETLYRLPQLAGGIVIAPVATLMQRISPRAFLDGSCLLLDLGDTLDLETMRRRLEASGYRCVSQVMEHGEFAVRGSLLDLYPMGSALPYRIDLLDDEVDSIRSFDPDTQRTLERVEGVRLLSAREFPLTGEAITRFRQGWRATFAGDPQASPVYLDVSHGIAPAGIEYYLPLFFEQTATLFQYLPDETLLAVFAGVEAGAETFWPVSRPSSLRCS